MCVCVCVCAYVQCLCVCVSGFVLFGCLFQSVCMASHAVSQPKCVRVWFYVCVCVRV